MTLTVVAGAAQITMAAYWPHATDLQRSVFAAMDFTWKAGIGAVFGLLGRKLID